MNEKSPVIVVEGKTEIDKLQKITKAILISTNGSSVPRETIEYIKELSKERKIIILTAPDYPGIRIRNILNKEIPNAYNAFVPRETASNGKKLGVAESPEEEILKALEKAQVLSLDKENLYLSLSDLYELELVGQKNSSELRNKIYKQYSLGYGNAKTLIKRLCSVGITKEEIKEYLKEVKNENSK